MYIERIEHLRVQKCPSCRGHLDRAVPLLCPIRSTCFPKAELPAGEALAFGRWGRGISLWEHVGGQRAASESMGVEWRGAGASPLPQASLKDEKIPAWLSACDLSEPRPQLEPWTGSPDPPEQVGPTNRTCAKGNRGRYQL